MKFLQNVDNVNNFYLWLRRRNFGSEGLESTRMPSHMMITHKKEGHRCQICQNNKIVKTPFCIFNEMRWNNWGLCSFYRFFLAVLEQ